jgi:hypothetical protein
MNYLLHIEYFEVLVILGKNNLELYEEFSELDDLERRKMALYKPYLDLFVFPYL